MKVPPVHTYPGLPPIYSVETIRTADLPPRTWYWTSFVPVGLVLLVGKKRTKKSFFAGALASAIAGGQQFLGEATVSAPVLIIHTELDLSAVHERSNLCGPQPAQVHTCFGWTWGEQALDDLDTVFEKLRYGVVIVDMLTAVSADNLDGFRYVEASRFWNRLRRIAQKHQAVVIGLWHVTKNSRRDHLDEILSSTGLVGQCDSVLMLRRHGTRQVTLTSTGNHSEDRSLLLSFENGHWKVEKELLAEDKPSGVGEAAHRCLELVGKHPEGVTCAFVAASLNGGSATRKEQDATRKTLDRLAEKGLLNVRTGADSKKFFIPLANPGQHSEEAGGL